MDTAKLLKQLEKMTNEERLVVIEEASRLIREELCSANGKEEEDPIFKVAGCLSGQPLASSEIDEILYGKLEAE
jgi:hypothetical protein